MSRRGESVKRDAVMVDLTTRESTAASELVIASGKLMERKSEVSCCRRTRKGRTIRRVSARLRRLPEGVGLAMALRTASADAYRSSRFFDKSLYTTSPQGLSIVGGSS